MLLISWGIWDERNKNFSANRGGDRDHRSGSGL
jgi:hypothetical protein